ncbi:MAG: HAD family hydrolase [Geminicoccaceae bacterium]
METVVFDLGGVLIDWNPRYLYRKLFNDDAAMEHFLTEICSPAWNVQMDEGKPFAVAVEELSAQHTEHETMIRAYHQRWPEMIDDAIPGTVALLEQLTETDVRLHALTNWSAETFPIARQRFSFLGHFETILVSGEEKLIKPDPAIFRLLAERTGLEPTNTLFIDDSERNITAAKELGFFAHHFSSPDALEQELQELGLL